MCRLRPGKRCDLSRYLDKPIERSASTPREATRGIQKNSLILLAAFALLAAPPALAAKGDTWMGFRFGLPVPTGDFSGSPTYGLEGGLVGTHFESEHVGVGMDLAFDSWSGPDAANAPVETVLGPGTVKLFSIGGTYHILQTRRPAVRLFTVGVNLMFGMGSK